jgi:hypothetical protein
MNIVGRHENGNLQASVVEKFIHKSLLYCNNCSVGRTKHDFRILNQFPERNPEKPNNQHPDYEYSYVKNAMKDCEDRKNQVADTDQNNGNDCRECNDFISFLVNTHMEIGMLAVLFLIDIQSGRVYVFLVLQDLADLNFEVIVKRMPNIKKQMVQRAALHQTCRGCPRGRA